MSDTETVECPHCHEWVSPGNMCEECGQELPAIEEKPEATPASVEKVKPSPVIQDTAPPAPEPISTNETDTLGSISQATTAGSQKKKTATPVPFPKKKPSPSSAPSFTEVEDDFILEYNITQFFILNVGSSFHFRLTKNPKGKNDLSDVKISIDVYSNKDKHIERNFFNNPSPRPQEQYVNFTPSTLGINNNADFTVTYLKNGEEKKAYVGSFRWDCLEKETPASKVFENLTIHLEDINADGAADQNINMLNDLKGSSGNSFSDTLSQVKLQPAWKALDLYPQNLTKPLPVSKPKLPAGYPTSQITLERQDGFRVHLFSQSVLRMGRSANSCELTLRVFDHTAKHIDKEACFGLSRIHTTISHKNGKFFIQDGGSPPEAPTAPPKPSGMGSYLNNTALKADPPTQLKASAVSSLAIGGEKKGGNDLVSFSIRPIKSGDKHVALILLRDDKVKEIYVILIDSFSLNEAGSEFPEVRLIRNNNAFYADYNEYIQPLMPDGRMFTGEQIWKVENFNQYGV